MPAELSMYVPDQTLIPQIEKKKVKVKSNISQFIDKIDFAQKVSLYIYNK